MLRRINTIHTSSQIVICIQIGFGAVYSTHVLLTITPKPYLIMVHGPKGLLDTSQSSDIACAFSARQSLLLWHETPIIRYAYA